MRFDSGFVPSPTVVQSDALVYVRSPFKKNEEICLSSVVRVQDLHRHPWCMFSLAACVD